MKYNKTIKALECVAKNPLPFSLKDEVMIASLDLINHQKAEIKSLTEKLEALGDPLQDAQYKIAEQQAEIERLKDIKFKMIDKFRDTLADEYLRLCNYNDFNKLNLERIVDTLNEVFDNLVKEMVGDAE